VLQGCNRTGKWAEGELRSFGVPEFGSVLQGCNTAPMGLGMECDDK
jgi:hypothetical protein